MFYETWCIDSTTERQSNAESEAEIQILQLL